MNATASIKRDVLMSIRPSYASKILAGEKTVELRRRFPESTRAGTTILIYSSSPVCAIIGYAKISEVIKLPVPLVWEKFGNAACISKEAFDKYFVGLSEGFAILLNNVKPLTRHVTAHFLRDEFGYVPPQSFRYVGEECSSLFLDERIQAPNRHKRRHRA